MVPNEKFPYEFLAMVNADVELDIAKLVVNQGLQADNVKLKTTLKDNRDEYFEGHSRQDKVR